MKKLKIISAGLFLAASLAFLGMRLGFASVPAGTINRIENAVIWAGSPPAPVTSNTPLPVNASNSTNLIVSSTVPYSTDMTSGSLGALNAVFSGEIFGGTGTAQVRIQGTWSGTITFYKRILTVNSSGSAYVLVPAEAYPVGGGLPATSTTANGEWNIPLTGLSDRDSIEFEMTSYTSGTAYAAFSPGGTTGIVQAVQPDGANLNVTPNLGNKPVSSTNPLPVSIPSSSPSATNLTEVNSAAVGITNGLYTVPGRIQVPRFVWSDNKSTIAGINACLLGNATSTEFVTGISFDDTALTAGTDSFEISLYSTQASGGTSTALNPISTNDSTLYGTGLIYSAAPTAGTEKGQLASYFNNAPSTISSDTTVEGAYINLASQPVRINSGQEICIVSGAAGNLMSWNIYGYEVP